jgi:hypothetical protein
MTILNPNGIVLELYMITFKSLWEDPYIWKKKNSERGSSTLEIKTEYKMV